jgi:hypothetical protein
MARNALAHHLKAANAGNGRHDADVHPTFFEHNAWLDM